MIVVKIELWPKGDANRAKELGRIYIANTGGLKTDKKGDYKVAVCRKGSTKCPMPVNGKAAIKAARLGEVKNFPRKSYSVWRLISRALLSAFPEENK